jgi:hypothetical protein
MSLLNLRGEKRKRYKYKQESSNNKKSCIASIILTVLYFSVGLIQLDGGSASYEFGIMGLSCKREILQVGDPVTFQTDSDGRACNIVPVRKKRRATVDAIKGTCSVTCPLAFLDKLRKSGLWMMHT